MFDRVLNTVCWNYMSRMLSCYRGCHVFYDNLIKHATKNWKHCKRCKTRNKIRARKARIKLKACKKWRHVKHMKIGSRERHVKKGRHIRSKDAKASQVKPTFFPTLEFTSLKKKFFNNRNKHRNKNNCNSSNQKWAKVFSNVRG